MMHGQKNINIYMGYIRLPGLLKYKALLFLPVIIIDLTLCTMWSGVGRDSSVGIATRYGLDGPGIESRWGRDFSHLSRPELGPTQPRIRGEFRPRQTRQLPRAVDLKGRLLSCQSY